jgi:electron transport complex protein RnfD
MTKSEKKYLAFSVSPHLAEGTRTQAVMWTVSASLAPALVWGFAMFGLPAAAVVAAAVAGALVTELAVNGLRGRLTIGDGSAFLTGLLLGMSLPPATPLYVPLCASVFAMAVVKHACGGLGANWMNPAMAGRVFALLSFPAAMHAWLRPATLPTWNPGQGAADALTGATPLGTVKTALAEIYAGFAGAAGPGGAAAALKSAGGPAGVLAANGYPVTVFDGQLTGWLNGLFGGHLKPGYFDLFFGNAGGSIGEVSIFLLLLGAVVLFVRKIISWEIPVSFLGTFALVSWAFGGLPFAGGLFTGDVAFQLLTGGVVFAAFFLANDYVTAPLTRSGKIIFGAGVGLFTFLIRFIGVLPEGVSVAIIFMNVFVPLIDRIIRPNRARRTRGAGA